MMLKAIHAKESKKSAREKVASVAQQLREMKLSVTAQKMEETKRRSHIWTIQLNTGIESGPTTPLNASIERSNAEQKRLEHSLMVKVL